MVLGAADTYSLEHDKSAPKTSLYNILLYYMVGILVKGLQSDAGATNPAFSSKNRPIIMALCISQLQGSHTCALCTMHIAHTLSLSPFYPYPLPIDIQAVYTHTEFIIDQHSKNEIEQKTWHFYLRGMNCRRNIYRIELKSDQKPCRIGTDNAMTAYPQRM